MRARALISLLDDRTSRYLVVNLADGSPMVMDVSDPEDGVSLEIQPGDHEAVATVKTNLRAKKDNDFKAYVSTLSEDPGEVLRDLGVISLVVHSIEVMAEETQSIKNYYAGSDLAQKAGWSDEYIEENTIVVLAVYTVDYDNTKVPYDEGTLTHYFHLIRKDKDSPWRIWQSYYAGRVWR